MYGGLAIYIFAVILKSATAQQYRNPWRTKTTGVKCFLRSFFATICLGTTSNNAHILGRRCSVSPSATAEGYTKWALWLYEFLWNFNSAIPLARIARNCARRFYIHLAPQLTMPHVSYRIKRMLGWKTLDKLSRNWKKGSLYLFSLMMMNKSLL